MHSRLRVRASNRLRGLRTRQLPSGEFGDYSQDSVSGIYLDPNGQIVASDNNDPNFQGATGEVEDPRVPHVSSAPSDQNVAETTAEVSSLIPSATATDVGAPLSITPTSVAAPTTEITDVSPVLSSILGDASSIAASISSDSILSPSTITATPSSSIPHSSSVTSTEPTTNVTSAISEERASLYIGIAMAGLSVVGILVLTLGWLVRTRCRGRYYKEKYYKEKAGWPWDDDALDPPHDKLERGLGIQVNKDGSGSLRHWDASLMTEKSYETDESRPHLRAYPDPVPPPPAHTHPNTSSPFVTVTLHNSEQSVADLTQDMGNLQITNLMPGDISGGETSRASTALGLAHTYPAEYGTPFQPQRPCYTALEDGGLQTPWAPLRTRKSRAEELRARTQQPTSDTKLDEPLPYPGDVAPNANPFVEDDGKQETWASSIRSNIYNAYSAFSAAVGSTSNLPVTNNTPSDDAFTRPPTRRATPHRRGPRGPRKNSVNLSRSSTFSSVAGWTLEETSDGRGVVHFRGSPSQPVHDPFGDNVHIPASVHTPTRDRRLSLDAHPEDRAAEANSIYSTGSYADRVRRVGPHPPRLPSIPNFSECSSNGEVDTSKTDRDQAQGDTHRSQHRKRTKRQRRPTRKSSSQASATSVGSEMSRTSTTCSDQLTDGERFARQVLKERRRRVMEMTVGRAKPSRSRATTLSRRRSMEHRGKQRLDIGRDLKEEDVC